LGCHSGRLGVTVGDWGVTVKDWGVTVGVVVTVVDITVGEIGVTDGTMVVSVEEWFITVVGAWRGRSAKQGGLTQPPTSLRENIDLRVGPESQSRWSGPTSCSGCIGLSFAQLLGSKQSRDIWNLLSEQGRG